MKTKIQIGNHMTLTVQNVGGAVAATITRFGDVVARVTGDARLARKIATAWAGAAAAANVAMAKATSRPRRRYRPTPAAKPAGGVKRPRKRRTQKVNPPAVAVLGDAGFHVA